MPPCSLIELAAAPQASLLILHGLAEYAERYRHVARAFAARRISTFGIDQCGHGSRTPRTHIDRFDQFVHDALTTCRQVRTEQPALPLFVWGHSMGSMVALQLAARHGDALDGLILTSPSLDVFTHRRLHPLNPVFRALARIAPRIRIPLTLDASQISSDEVVQRAYANDPLIPKTASLQLLIEFSLACEHAEGTANRVRVPTLILHGAEDRIAPSSGSQRLYEQLELVDKELRVLPELRHELHNEREPERTEVLESIAAWVLQRALGPTSSPSYGQME